MNYYVLWGWEICFLFLMFIFSLFFIKDNGFYILKFDLIYMVRYLRGLS